MKAAVIASPGAPAEYESFREPEPNEGREIVQLVAAGIHPIVRALATGSHYGSSGTWPMIPGVDAVARTADGAIVYTGYAAAPFGTLAERISVPARMRIPLPADADPVAIAAGLNPGLSSWMPLQARAADGPIGTAVILGATGSAGLLAVQNARAAGADRIVAVGRDHQRLERAETLGAKATVALTGDLDADRAAIDQALGGTAPSLVLDYVWGSAAEAMFRALEGHSLGEDDADIHYVQIGQEAGANASLPASLLRSRRIRISGSGAGSGSVAEIMAQLPMYMKLIADGTIAVPTRTYSLSEVAEAWRAAGAGGDRVVIIP